MEFFFFFFFDVLVVAEVSAVAPLSLVVAVLLVVASTGGVAAVVSVLVLVLGVDTGGVDVDGSIVLGVDGIGAGVVVCGLVDGVVCAMATPEVPAISAPAKITNFMKSSPVQKGLGDQGTSAAKGPPRIQGIKRFVVESAVLRAMEQFLVGQH